MASFVSRLQELKELKDLLDASKAAYDDVKFHPYRLGKWCNAAKSASFSDAICDLNCIAITDEIGVGLLPVKPLDLGLNVLYQKGFDVLRKVFSSDYVKNEDFDEPSKKALKILIDFIKNKGNHMQSLEKMLKDPNNEVEVTAVIAQHFLGRLCPAEGFFIDSRLNGSQNSQVVCKCGCNAVIKTGTTGIGHEKVWHGYIDILFESHGDVTAGASVAKRPRVELEVDEDEGIDEAVNVTEENLNLSLDGQNGVEVNFSKIVENQAAAEAIVFSILQRNRHTELNSLIPFVVVSASEVIIFMYDKTSDIFFRSPNMPIFTSYWKDIEPVTMITVWMILHYKYFCSGIPLEDFCYSLEHVKSGFADHIQTCSDIYDSISSFVNDFETHDENQIIREKLDNYKSRCMIDGSKIPSYP